jgi:transposase InsO family protein
MEVQVKHGLPYNPQGQGIIERTHRTIKDVTKSFSSLYFKIFKFE